MKHLIIFLFAVFLTALQPAMAQEDSLYTDSVPILNIDQTLDSCFKALDYSSKLARVYKRVCLLNF